jgi:hypothetical protein
MIDQLITNLSYEVQIVRPAPHPFKLSLQWLSFAALYLIVSLFFSGLRPDIFQLGFWFYLEIISLLLVVITTSLGAALLVFPDLHQRPRLVFAPLAAFVLLLFVLLLAGLTDNPSAPYPVHSFECTLSITLLSLLPALSTLFAMRKFASTHCYLAGGTALLFAFSVGALWLRLHEINNSILHVVEWHYLPMLIIALIGMWLGGKMLKW